MSWVKISAGSKRGRQASNKCSVYRYSSQKNRARLNIPKSMLNFDRVDIYCDGGGKLGFRGCADGGYLATVPKGSRLRQISIPTQFTDSIPFGRTTVDMDKDGEMLILDLTTLDK